MAAHTQTVSYREHMDPLLIVAASPPTCATLPPMTPTTYGGLIPLADMSFLLAMRSAVPASSQIGALINTHANGDHTFGNQLVEGARIIASQACAKASSKRANLRSLPIPLKNFP